MTLTRLNDRWDLDLPDHRVQHWLDNPMWEQERLASIHANLKPGDVVFDIGAEHGDFSALFATWVNLKDPLSTLEGLAGDTTEPEAREATRVVCVEPASWYWPSIRATFLANGVMPRGSVHGFVADYTRNIASRAPDLSGGWPSCAFDKMTGRQGFANVLEAGQERIVLTVDQLAGIFGAPRALSIDVEGAEILVMRGAAETLRDHRPLVWISVHPEMMWHDHGVYEAELHSQLHQWDYEKAHLAFDHEHHWFYWPRERRDQVVLP